jgi:amino acid permease
MQALAELAVMYPINGAFTMYIVRFIDPSWGFACGWQYGIGWLTTLPFEISAACNVSGHSTIESDRERLIEVREQRSFTTGMVLQM